MIFRLFLFAVLGTPVASALRPFTNDRVFNSGAFADPFVPNMVQVASLVAVDLAAVKVDPARFNHLYNIMVEVMSMPKSESLQLAIELSRSNIDPRKFQDLYVARAHSSGSYEKNAVARRFAVQLAKTPQVQTGPALQAQTDSVLAVLHSIGMGDSKIADELVRFHNVNSIELRRTHETLVNSGFLLLSAAAAALAVQLQKLHVQAETLALQQDRLVHSLRMSGGIQALHRVLLLSLDLDDPLDPLGDGHSQAVALQIADLQDVSAKDIKEMYRALVDSPGLGMVPERGSQALALKLMKLGVDRMNLLALFNSLQDQSGFRLTRIDARDAAIKLAQLHVDPKKLLTIYRALVGGDFRMTPGAAVQELAVQLAQQERVKVDQLRPMRQAVKDLNLPVARRNTAVLDLLTAGVEATDLKQIYDFLSSGGLAGDAAGKAIELSKSTVTVLHLQAMRDVFFGNNGLSMPVGPDSTGLAFELLRRGVNATALQQLFVYLTSETGFNLEPTEARDRAVELVKLEVKPDKLKDIHRALIFSVFMPPGKETQHMAVELAKLETASGPRLTQMFQVLRDISNNQFLMRGCKDLAVQLVMLDVDDLRVLQLYQLLTDSSGEGMRMNNRTLAAEEAIRLAKLQMEPESLQDAYWALVSGNGLRMLDTDETRTQAMELAMLPTFEPQQLISLYSTFVGKEGMNMLREKCSQDMAIELAKLHVDPSELLAKYTEIYDPPNIDNRAAAQTRAIEVLKASAEERRAALLAILHGGIDQRQDYQGLSHFQAESAQFRSVRKFFNAGTAPDAIAEALFGREPGMGMAEAAAQAAAAELTGLRVDPADLRALHKILLNVHLQSANADAARFDTVYADVMSRCHETCQLHAKFEAINADLQGLARRQAYDPEAAQLRFMAADQFQRLFGQLWLSFWLDAPVEQRVDAGRLRSAPEFANLYGNAWVARWMKSRPAEGLPS